MQSTKFSNRVRWIKWINTSSRQLIHIIIRATMERDPPTIAPATAVEGIEIKESLSTTTRKAAINNRLVRHGLILKRTNSILKATTTTKLTKAEEKLTRNKTIKEKQPRLFWKEKKLIGIQLLQAWSHLEEQTRKTEFASQIYLAEIVYRIRYVN